MIINVYPSDGAYLVVERMRLNDPLEVYVVGKDKSCSCGRKMRCRHVEAVRNYLVDGGDRAPEAKTLVQPSSPTMTCHICGGPVSVDGPYWKCLADSSHYWQWRGETFGVKAFLTQPHPNKMGAFYEQTDEQRDRFLAAAKRRYAKQLIERWA